MEAEETTPEQQISETPAQTLARSAFGFALLAFAAALITWIGLLLSPVSPDAAFAQIRTVIVVGFGLVTVALLGACVYALRAPMDRLTALMTPVAGTLRHRWLSVILALVLIEANFLAFQSLTYVAPAITEPGKFLLVCWSLLLLGMVLTVNRDGLRRWLGRTGDLWTGLGLILAAAAALAVLYILTGEIVQRTGLENALRGGLDYRGLTFYDDGQPAPSSQAFWEEQSQTIVRWLPYSYWTVAPFSGSYITVGADGVRNTPSYVPDDDSSAKPVYFFGGSTMWGEGARDAYTIAGHVARLLNEDGTPQRVVNYGQTGYVSMQDLILFENQLAQGNVPDLAIFYQGFNDVFGAYTQDRPGIPFSESQRVDDSEAGRLLRGGLPVLRPLNSTLDGMDWSLVTQPGATAQAIVDRYLANVRLIRAAAAEYDVQVFFVWQPIITHKQPLTDTETSVVDQTEQDMPGFFALYDAVDTLLRQRVADEGLGDFLILSDLFKDDTRSLFFDKVHITEDGNYTVAQAVLPEILKRLSPNN